MVHAILILLALLWASPAFSAWGTGGGKCTVNNKTTGTSLQCTVSTENLDAGNVVVIPFGGDNTQTTDVNTNLMTSVTDSQGNTWTYFPCWTNGQGSAAAGATVCGAMSVLTTALVSGVDTITVNHSSITARAFNVFEYTKGASSIVYARGSSTVPGFLSNDGADPGSMTLDGVESREHLFLRFTALERAAGGTWTVSTNFSTLGCEGTTGGTATNIEICGEYRIVTGTSQTSNPTGTSVDSASMSLVLTEAVMPTGFVQECRNGIAAAGTTIVCKMGFQVMAGNLLACYTTDMSTTDTVTMSDTLTQTWTVRSTYYADATNTERGVGVYAVNTVAGYEGITATWSASTNHRGIACHEVTGMSTTSPDDGYVGQSQQNPGTSTDAVKSTAITTTGTGGYMFGATFEPSDNCQNLTAGTGWTSVVLTGCQFPHTEARSGNAGSYNAEFTTGNATADYISIIQAFKPAGGGAGTDVSTLMLMGVH